MIIYIYVYVNIAHFMNFDICIHPKNTTIIKIHNISINPKSFFVPLCNLSLPLLLAPGNPKLLRAITNLFAVFRHVY